MSFDEKYTWGFGLIAVAGYGVYLALLLGQVDAAPLTEAAYVPLMLWTIGGAIAAGMLLTILVSMAAPAEANKRDQRDRDINRFGEYVGQSFVVIGGVAALLMAMAEWDHFWIANVIYLCFVLSAVLSSAAKIVAYRFGFHPW
ncbi:hypothetical protein [Devosia sp.]|uniref:hypothetical protein n=1 Tax=Devosia sp. TaxID=1871048 RepID=UPI002F089E95